MSLPVELKLFMYAGRGSLLGGEDEVIAFTFDETVYGCSVFSIRFKTPNWKVWDALLKDPDAMIRMRWGFESEGNSEYVEWKVMRLTDAELFFYPDRVEISANGFSWGYRMMERAGERSFYGAKLSDIFKELARQNGLPYDVEETEGAYNLYESNMTDAEFVKRCLVPNARSTGGRYGYLFYFRSEMRGDVACFKTPNLSGQPKTLCVLSTQDKVSGNRVIGPVSVSYLPIETFAGGSLTTRFRAFDPLQKKFIEQMASDKDTPHIALAKNTFTGPSTPNKIVVSPFQNQRDLRRIAHSSWCSNSRGLFGVRFSINPDLSLVPDTVVALHMSQARVEDLFVPQTHLLSGKYYVPSISHVYHNGRYEMEITGERRDYA